MGLHASRDRAAQMIWRVLREAARRESLPSRARKKDHRVGFFIQDLNLGWMVEVANGGLGWAEGFPHEVRNRFIFRNERDFHRFATGTPRLWLSFRGRARYRGSREAIRLIRKPIVRAYTRMRDSL